ncbi:MAG: 5-formyltetrahydrofolate cyclo-ligase [Colwellia sp.]|nr:5-formyltetrahydrofolate cyclo-ligase [Colwellia sp.]
MNKPFLIPTKKNTRTLIRQKLQSKRKTLTANFQKKAAQALLFTLKNDTSIKEAKHIALYLANNGELDLQPFIQWCWQQNKQLYLPVVHPFAKGHLLFLSYLPNSTMVINRYNIKEPKLDVRAIIPVQQLDIILTPLVAFDSTGARIGMGGGYYDRTLAKWYEHYLQGKSHQGKKDFQNKQFPLSPIGIAHDCQQITKVPHEAWDIPLPKIITPTRVIKVNTLK